MMDQPSLAELIGAVREFLLSKAVPELTGHTAFHARVAANALAIAERELAQRPAADACEYRRLVALLGMDGDLESLNRELCARIADGRMNMSMAGLLDHLERTAVAKVEIDQPRYSGLLEANERLGRG